MIEKPLKNEIQEWKQNKVSKYLMKRLEEDRKELMEMWAAGQFTAPDQSATIQLNSRALGMFAALEQVEDFLESDMDVEEMIQYDH